MFRLENNVPEVYVNESRDFQLFCRLYDVCFTSVKQSIDSLQFLTDTKQCSHQVLELLKSKVGLFTTAAVNDTELRYLLQAFPTIIRYKGSKRGVELLMTLYTHMYSGVTMPSIEYLDNHMVRLIFKTPPQNDRLLLELLDMILPTGYIVTYYVGRNVKFPDKERNIEGTKIGPNDVLLLNTLSNGNDEDNLTFSPETQDVSNIDSTIGTSIVGIANIANIPTEDD